MADEEEDSGTDTFGAGYDSETVSAASKYYGAINARQAMAYRQARFELEWQKYIDAKYQQARAEGRADADQIRKMAEAQRDQARLALQQQGYLLDMRKEARQIIQSAMQQVMEEQKAAREEVRDVQDDLRNYYTERREIVSQMITLAKNKQVPYEIQSSINSVRMLLGRYGQAAGNATNFQHRYADKMTAVDPNVKSLIAEAVMRYYEARETGIPHDEVMKDTVEPIFQSIALNTDEESREIRRQFTDIDRHIQSLEQQLVEAKKATKAGSFEEQVANRINQIQQATDTLAGTAAPGRASYEPDGQVSDPKESPTAVIAGYGPDGKPLILDRNQWGGSMTSSDGSVYLVPAKGASMDTIAAIEAFNKKAGKGKKVLGFPGKAVSPAAAQGGTPTSPPPSSPMGAQGMDKAAVGATVPTSPVDIGNGASYYVKDGKVYYQYPDGVWEIDPKTKQAVYTHSDGSQSKPVRVNQNPLQNPQATSDALAARVRAAQAQTAPGRQVSLDPRAQMELYGKLEQALDGFAQRKTAMMSMNEAATAGNKPVAIGPTQVNRALMMLVYDQAKKSGLVDPADQQALNQAAAALYEMSAMYLFKKHKDKFFPFDVPRTEDDVGQLGRQMEAWDRAWGSGMPDGYYVNPRTNERSRGGVGLGQSAETFPRVTGPMPLLPFFEPQFLQDHTYKTEMGLTQPE